MAIEYTKDQLSALDSLLTWYRGPVSRNDERTLLYLIDGAAGTGKTTITKKAIQELGLRSHQLAVTAPTHQAKKVIQQATDFTAQTIQKLLGLRPNVEMDNFDINNPQFDPLAPESIKFYKVVLIDESSMLNADSFDLILQKAKQFGVRIIFLGDAFQLPPIKEKISKVFTHVSNRSRLETIVRQSDDNPTANFLLGIREDIKNDNDANLERFIEQGTKVIGDRGYKIQTNTEFGSDLLNLFRTTEYEFDPMHIRYLTWTNKSVVAWSDAIRRQLLGEQAMEKLIEGESLIGYTTITNYRTSEIVLQNSETYTVNSITDFESTYNIKGYLVVLIDSDGTENEHFVVNDEGMDAFKETAFDLWRSAITADYKTRKRAWGKYYGFKENHLLLEDVYHNGMKISKDLYYAYGMTVHKSQGSTFTNTAINLRNIDANRVSRERRRLAYVALSRCRNMNLILAK